MSNYREMTVDRLRELLRGEGLSTTGKKSELIERLRKHDSRYGSDSVDSSKYGNLSVDRLKELLRGEGLSTSGSKSDLIKRLKKQDSYYGYQSKSESESDSEDETSKYGRMSVDRLKELLRGEGLSAQGKKSELIKRLEKNDALHDYETKSDSDDELDMTELQYQDKLSESIYNNWVKEGKQSYDKNNRVFYATMLVRLGGSRFLDKMIKNGLDINASNRRSYSDRGETALIQVAKMKNYYSPEIIVTLLQFGANPSYLDDKHHSFMYYYIYNLPSSSYAPFRDPEVRSVQDYFDLLSAFKDELKPLLQGYSIDEAINHHGYFRDSVRLAINNYLSS